MRVRLLDGEKVEAEGELVFFISEEVKDVCLNAGVTGFNGRVDITSGSVINNKPYSLEMIFPEGEVTIENVIFTSNDGKCTNVVISNAEIKKDNRCGNAYT